MYFHGANNITYKFADFLYMYGVTPCDPDIHPAYVKCMFFLQKFAQNSKPVYKLNIKKKNILTFSQS